MTQRPYRLGTRGRIGTRSRFDARSRAQRFPTRGATRLTVGALGLLFMAVSCGEPQPAPQAEAEGKASLSYRPLRDVLDAKLASWGIEPRKEAYAARELRADIGVLPMDGAGEASAPDSDAETTGAGPPPVDPPMDQDQGSSPPLDPDLIELREGLVGMVLGNPRQLALAQGDIANLAGEIVPVLKAGLFDATRPAAEQKVLIDLASAAPNGELAVALAQIASESDETWLRRYAAYGISAHADAEGADAAIPQLFFRMKYEEDAEAVGWVAKALSDLHAPAAIARAEQALQRLSDSGTLEAQIFSLRMEEADRPATALEPSAALLQSTWLWIADLSGKHFQLRGVDDARFVLASLGPWAATQLAEALEDDDSYVRLHVAQVLGRMGPRGSGAAASLTLALRDPNEGVRGTAAESLVAVAGDLALEPLLDRLAEAPSHADRVSLARALSALPTQVPVEHLKALFAQTPASDLKLAAAHGLLFAGHKDVVLPWLADELVAPIGDRAGAETLLGKWLHSLDPKDRGAWLPGWDRHAPAGSIIHDAKGAAARRRARSEWLKAEVVDSPASSSR